MKKQIDNEYHMTRSRVEYHLAWDRGGAWTSTAINLFEQRLAESTFSQLFVPIMLDSKKATDTLYENPELNRLFSILIDTYDELPTRPDVAFDLCWRAFEIEMNMYKNEAWGISNGGTTRELIARICREAIFPLYSSETAVKESIDALFEQVSVKSLSFCLTRAVAIAELTVLGQNSLILERIKSALGIDLWEAIKNKYFPSGNTISAQNKRKACFLLLKILKGEKIVLENQFYELDVAHRLEFLVSGVLYTSRCERFHGDYFSPFKSDKATLYTFYDFYYQLITTYTLFWCLLYKFINYRKISIFFAPLDIKQALDESLRRIQILPNK